MLLIRVFFKGLELEACTERCCCPGSKRRAALPRSGKGKRRAREGSAEQWRRSERVEARRGESTTAVLLFHASSSNMSNVG